MYRQGVLLCAVMITSLVAVVLGVVLRFMPGLDPLPLLVAVAVIALESGVTHDAYRRNRMWSGEFTAYLAPELLLLAVMVRVAVGISVHAPLAQQASGWLADPLSIFDPAFVLLYLCALGIGILCHLNLGALHHLLPKEFERAEPSLDSEAMMRVVAQDRADALRAISTRFVVGGVLILAALAIAVVDVRQFGGAGLPVHPISAGGAMIYLISGFLFYSQARLALLHTRWRMEGATVSPLVMRRWSQSSWLVIGGIALGAGLLPRAYGMGLLDSLRFGMGAVGYVLVLLGYAVIWLFSLILFIPAYLMSLLFNSDDFTAPPPEVGQMPQMPAEPEKIVTPPNLVAALIFWACVLVLVGYAVWLVLRRHPLLAQRIVAPFAGLRRWLLNLFGRSKRVAGQVAQVVRERAEERERKRRQNARLRLRSHTPRERIRGVYHSLLRNAAQNGMTRAASQTPAEYQKALGRNFPEAQPEIDELTNLFVIATYAPVSPPEDDAKRANSLGQWLKTHLRRKSPGSGVKQG